MEEGNQSGDLAIRVDTATLKKSTSWEGEEKDETRTIKWQYNTIRDEWQHCVEWCRMGFRGNRRNKMHVLLSCVCMVDYLVPNLTYYWLIYGCWLILTVMNCYIISHKINVHVLAYNVQELKLKVMVDILLGMWLTSVHRCGGSRSAIPCHSSGSGGKCNFLLYNFLDKLVKKSFLIRQSSSAAFSVLTLLVVTRKDSQPGQYHSSSLQGFPWILLGITS